MTQEHSIPLDYSKSPVPADLEKAFSDNAPQVRVEKFFKPGLHDVKIGRIVSSDKARNDDAWTNLCVEFDGTGEKRVRGWLLIPNTSDLLYGAKRTNYPFKKVCAFARALGVSVTKDNYPTTLKALFLQPEKLLGRSLRITVGYSQAHVQYAGKRSDGTVYFVIADRNNESLKDEAGLDRQFGDKDAAKLYAEQVGMKIESLPGVLDYHVGPQSTAAKVDDIF